MSNVHNFNDYERNSNSTSGSSGGGGGGIGGYNEGGKFNPWMKPQQQQQQRGYAQLDQQQAQQGSGILSGLQLTWKSFAAINLIAVWVIFLITKIIAAVTDNNFNCIVFQAGAQYQPSITYNYEFHRYLFPIYLHGGFPHIISNSFGLFFYAFSLEQQYGLKKFMFFYFLCGIGGNLLSGFNSPEQMSVGASSSLFGLFPLMILFLMENQTINKNQKTFYIVYILIMVFANFFGSNQKPVGEEEGKGESEVRIVDTAAHIGGLLTGLCLSAIYSQIQHPKAKYIKIASYAALILGLGFLFFYNQFNYDLHKPDSMQRVCAWK